MTEQKAYELVNAHLKCIDKSIALTCNGGCDNNCDDCDLCYEQGTVGQHKEAIEIAVEALEKQIPKKVINRCMFCECPTCGNVEIQSNSYCCDCGQRLDWSEE